MTRRQWWPSWKRWGCAKPSLRRETGSDFCVRGRLGGGPFLIHGPEGTPVGATQLVLLTADVPESAECLKVAGLQAITWDESYGRHAGLTDPAGGGVWINEQLANPRGLWPGAPAPALP